MRSDVTDIEISDKKLEKIEKEIAEKEEKRQEKLAKEAEKAEAKALEVEIEQKQSVEDSASKKPSPTVQNLHSPGRGQASAKAGRNPR